jgi:hypothetical protein
VGTSICDRWFDRSTRRYPVDSGAVVTKFNGMKRVRKSEKSAAALRQWRVSVFRKRLERLGRVAAPDEAAAEAAAVAEFGLKHHEPKRLLVEEVQ